MRGWGLVLLAAALVLFAAPAGAQPVKVLHIKIAGVIDCRRIGEDFAAELQRARADNIGFLVLELEGAASRLDVVWQMAQSLRSSGIPSAALLNGNGDGLGAEHAALGAILEHCFIKPRAMIAATSRSQELRELAPVETEWARIVGEFGDALAASLSVRGADPAFTTILLNPAQDAWMVETAAGAAIATERPESPQPAEQILWTDGEMVRLRLTAEAALRLKLAEATVESPSQVLARCKVQQASMQHRIVKSGLGQARREVGDALAKGAVALERVEELLKVKQRHDRTITNNDYRRAGEEGLRQIAELDRSIRDIDAQLATYPEFLRFQAKGSRSTRPPADSVPGKLQKLRADLEKLRVTATEYATRR
jgi:hypothetical protein